MGGSHLLTYISIVVKRFTSYQYSIYLYMDIYIQTNLPVFDDDDRKLRMNISSQVCVQTNNQPWKQKRDKRADVTVSWKIFAVVK